MCAANPNANIGYSSSNNYSNDDDGRDYYSNYDSYDYYSNDDSYDYSSEVCNEQ